MSRNRVLVRCKTLSHSKAIEKSQTSDEEMASELSVEETSDNQANSPLPSTSKPTSKSRERGVGATAVLTREDESKFCNWLSSVSKCGFCITERMFLDAVQMYLKKIDRHTTYLNNRPDHDWYERFLKRHPETQLLQLESASRNQSALTEANVKEWFINIGFVLGSDDSVLSEPHRVFNMRETAIFANSKQHKVLVSQTSGRSVNEKFSFLLGANAEGELCPPLVVFEQSKVPVDVDQSVPFGFTHAVSMSGSMTVNIFYKYIVHEFSRWLNEKSIKRPIVIFLDGTKAFLSQQLYSFCKNQKIYLFALFPTHTHLLQPIDVGFLRAFELRYQAFRDIWAKENAGNDFTSENFVIILKNSLHKAARNTKLFPEGFRDCGIYPFDADAINYKRILNLASCAAPPIDDEEEAVACSANTNLNPNEELEKLLSENISPEIIASFEQFSSQGAEHFAPHPILFKIWKRFRELYP